MEGCVVQLEGTRVALAHSTNLLSGFGGKLLLPLYADVPFHTTMVHCNDRYRGVDGGHNTSSWGGAVLKGGDGQ